MSALRISPRTGRPVRRYNDQIHTTVKAIDFDERAIRKLVTKWPEGAPFGNELEPWPRHLSAILMALLKEGSGGPHKALLTWSGGAK